MKLRLSNGYGKNRHNPHRLEKEDNNKFVLAASGSIPWFGDFLSAAASYKAEEGSITQYFTAISTDRGCILGGRSVTNLQCVN